MQVPTSRRNAHNSKAVALWATLYGSAMTSGAATYSVGWGIWNAMSDRIQSQPVSSENLVPQLFVASTTLALAYCAAILTYKHYKPANPPADYSQREKVSKGVIIGGIFAFLCGAPAYGINKAMQQGAPNQTTSILYDITTIALVGGVAVAVSRAAHRANKNMGLLKP